MESNLRSSASRPDRRWLAGGLFLVLLLAVVAPPGVAQTPPGMTLGLSDAELPPVEDPPSASSESTIVGIPILIDLKKQVGRKIGYRLRMSLYFSWKDVSFQDITGDDIKASFNSITVVPGIEFLVPVGERWLVRPYAQFGGVNALDIEGHRWIGSLGSRTNASWDFERWIFSAGGRLDYTTILDENLDKTDNVAFVDVMVDFSFPLWFNVMGDRALAGVFVIPRYYLSTSDLVGQGGFALGVESHIEIGASFQIHERPKVGFIKIPKWYGIGGRFAENYTGLRIYFGFPF